jgi:hypothetical protein
LYNLFDGLPQDYASTTHFSFAEVVASRLEMIILDLSVFEGELPGSALTREVVAVGVFVLSSIGTGVQHLVVEVLVVAGHAAPSRGSSRTEVMGCFAVGGNVVEPGAIRTMAAFFVLVLCQDIVLRVFAIPRDGTSCSTP